MSAKRPIPETLCAVTGIASLLVFITSAPAIVVWGWAGPGKFIILLASILGVAAIMFAARLAADDRKQTAKEERWRAEGRRLAEQARAEVQRDGYLRRNQAPGRGAHSWDLGGTRKFYPAPGPEAGRATPPTTDPGEWPHE
jgi:hypothetical protein